MKRMWIALLALALCLAVSAGCGKQESPSSTPTPEQSSAPQPTQTAEVQNPAAAVQALVGASVEEVYETIGKPDSSAYQDSCAVAGAQDGFLYYDGFTVVTLKTADGETVQSIE